jgi:hypothetical protein
MWLRGALSDLGHWARQDGSGHDVSKVSGKDFASSIDVSLVFESILSSPDSATHEPPVEKLHLMNPSPRTISPTTSGTWGYSLGASLRVCVLYEKLPDCMMSHNSKYLGAFLWNKIPIKNKGESTSRHTE